MELTGLIPIIRRWITVIAVATGVAVVVALLVGGHAQKTYESRAQLFVGPLSTDSDTIRASGDLAQTYAVLATSGNVLGDASRDTGVPTDELTGSVRATANSTTRFLIIRARSHDSATAAKVANSVSRHLIELSRQDLTRPEGQVRVIDPAVRIKSAVSPRLDLIVPLAGLAGLLGSITLVLLFEFVGDTAESIEKVEAASGLTAIAVKRRARRASIDGRDGDPLRIVATQAELSASPITCVLITGIGRDDGTVQFARDMAELWSQRHRHVVVLDAESGAVTEFDASVDEAGDANRSGRKTGTGRPHRRQSTVEMATNTPLPGIESLDVSDARNIMGDLVGPDGLLVVHGLPSTLSAATLVWAQVADVTVLAVRRFQSRRVAIEEAASNLRIVGAHVPFVVLLDVPVQLWKRSRGTTPSTDMSPPSPAGSTDDTGTDHATSALTDGRTSGTSRVEASADPTGART